MRNLSAFLLVASITLVISCSNNASTNNKTPNDSFGNGYKWTKLTDSASFKKSYNFQLFSFHDTLWAFHPDGNYSSLDGSKWIKSALSNAINNLAFLDYVSFNNAIYGLGHFEGNIEHYALTTAIYRSSNMQQWDTIAKESNLPKRFFYHPFVFDNKLWLIGGSDGKTYFADAWNSTDAVHWQKVADSLPFKKEGHYQFVHLNNKLYMIAEDVWSSTNAIEWKKETDRIVPEEIHGGTAIVFDNKIWLLGCNRDKKFSSEILVSEDGKAWKGMNAAWSPRGGLAACVHKGKLYITGGKYGGFAEGTSTTEFIYSNDVWCLEKL